MSRYHNLTGYGPSGTLPLRNGRLIFDGDERNYEKWEIKFLGYMRLQKLKAVFVSDDVPDPEKNEEAFAELIQFLDDRSLSLIMRDAEDDGRKALSILRAHYAGEGKPRIISLYTELMSLVKNSTESVTDYVIRAETAAMALRNAEEKYMNKRIPKNPKFNNVKPTIDTGRNIRKYVDRVDELKRNFKYKQDEIFKRIRLTTFVTLVIQTCNLSYFDVSAVDEHYSVESEGQMSGRNDEDKFHAEYLSKSRLQRIISGTGERDIENVKKTQQSLIGPKKPEEALPYLLLDVRDSEAFTKCHIKSAVNYPSAMLSRSVNYETKELLQYKNRPRRVIILYDENETIANIASTTLVQRGYDNIFLLSGGLKVVAQNFKHGLIYGSLPESCISGSSYAKKRSKNYDTYKLNVSTELAESDQFSQEDVECLQAQLDDTFNFDSSSSRAVSSVSSVCPYSSRSGASTIKSSASTKLRPWK